MTQTTQRGVPPARFIKLTHPFPSFTPDSSILILDTSDPFKPVEAHRIKIGSQHGEAGRGAPNSVSSFSGYIAVALDAEFKTDPGFLRIYSLKGPEYEMMAEVQVAAMPDMVTFSSDGKKLYVACEGEPSSQEVVGSDPNSGANPSGAFVIVTVAWESRTGQPSISNSKILQLQSYIDGLTTTQYAKLLADGFRVDPRLVDGQAGAGKDVEPEYIALSDDGRSAYVTLQVCGLKEVLSKLGNNRIKFSNFKQ